MLSPFFRLSPVLVIQAGKLIVTVKLFQVCNLLESYPVTDPVSRELISI